MSESILFVHFSGPQGPRVPGAMEIHRSLCRVEVCVGSIGALPERFGMSQWTCHGLPGGSKFSSESPDPLTPKHANFLGSLLDHLDVASLFGPVLPIKA